MRGWAVQLVGSNALYHAKLDWIKIWTQWECTVLMKGIFFTFGSVKIAFIKKAQETKCEVMLLIPFQGAGFACHLRGLRCGN